MAEAQSFLEEDFSCPICCDIFEGPVVLKCSHSLCEECLREYWDTQVVLQCPVCRKECSPDEPTRSLAFSSLCENFKNIKCAAPAIDICLEHDEKLKLFCFEDKQPICVVCYTSKKHKDHHCAPIVEAVEDLKLLLSLPGQSFSSSCCLYQRADQSYLQGLVSLLPLPNQTEVQSGISGLRQNLQILNKSKSEYELLAETIKDERQNVEKMLRQEFDSLHQFLKEEEEARMMALREEEMKKYEKTQKRIEKLSSDILNLSVTIQLINQKMEMDDITFLQNYASNHCNPAKYLLPEPEMLSGIDTAKHLQFLNVNLRAKMCELLSDPPLLVTLNPNTASNKLVVSEDRRSVDYMEQKQAVPDWPERLHVGVLGSQGFRSGLHCWDVEVGDNDHWTLGVVKESIERKRLLKMDPSSGMWSIRFTSGKYRVGVKSRKELSLAEKPRVIRVQLDYDAGTVTFSDPSKGPSLYTFTDTFTETMFPYFNTASTICPLHIS